MPSLFSKETAVSAATFLDQGKLTEVDQHQLLKTDQGSESIATFNQIKELGQWFLSIPFDKKPFLTSPEIPSHHLTAPDPQELLKNHNECGRGSFWAKLALGADPESHFPVTVEVIQTYQGPDLRLHIVPIHFGALEVAQYGRHTDGLLALAAAAAAAPHFILALEGGITTKHCAIKKEVVTSITPDHGTPLAVTFDTFERGHRTLDTAISVTGNKMVSIKQAAHLHGQEKPNTQLLSQAAAGSKIAAGVPIRTLLRSELPQHALFVQTAEDSFGNLSIVSVDESLVKAGVESIDLSLLSATLGFTSRVVGDSARERAIEQVLKPSSADIPLIELVKR